VKSSNRIARARSGVWASPNQHGLHVAVVPRSEEKTGQKLKR
jgi:hypothetical protein